MTIRNIEVEGIGVLVSVYVRDNKDNIEALKEASKTILREVIKLETRANRAADSASDSHQL